MRLVRSVFRWASLVWIALANAQAEPWPVAESDLPPHPGIHQGRLPNGLRFLTLPNAEPRDRVSLRLLVAAGSLHEAEDELGLAHFVEHMAFRGTRTHPAGSLVTALQRLGVGFGPDSTAFTSYDHTIYHLELPDPKEATLREGLRVFREYAEEVTFDPALIERERGVILSEKATRNTPEARSGEANLRFLFPSSRHVSRPIIGTEASIRALRREQFVSFYDAWYRPERIAVIVVGAIKPEEAARVITDELGGLRARGAARPALPDPAPPTATKPDVAIFSDPGLLGAGLTLQHPVPTAHGADTHARRVQTLHETLAFMMFHARLGRVALEPGATFVAPSAGLVPNLHGWRLAGFSASGKITDWRQVAGELEREHRRAFLHGFTSEELAEARANLTNGYDQAVRTSATWPSEWLATRLADSLVRGYVFVAPDSMKRDLATALAAADLTDCLRAFREAWTAAAPHVFISAHPSFNITREEIGAALNASRALATPAPVEADASSFAYTDFGPPGQLVRDDHVADLDVHLAEFANGARCNFKATTFEADTIEIRLRVGVGRLSQPAGQPGLDTLANAVVTLGGLGRHTAPELSRLLAGRSIGYSFQVDHDALFFGARCARRDLTFCLQVLTAHLTDIALRPEAMRDANARFGSLYASLDASPGGPITVYAPRVLLNGDSRFGPPLAPELTARKFEELWAWLDPQLKHGSIELSLVGDVTWGEASSALASTIGALPVRTPRGDTRANVAAVKFSKPASAPQLYPIDPKLGRAAIACYWPVANLKDFHEERRCRLLASVLSERLRVRLREELGTAYAPSAGFVDIRGVPHVSYYSLYAEVEPARTQQALKIIQREVASLAAKGPSPDEFNRALQPYIQQMQHDRRTNAYWGGTVLGDAQLTPSRLAAARDRTTDVPAITAEELTSLAKRHFTTKNVFTFMTVPFFTVPAKSPR